MQYRYSVLGALGLASNAIAAYVPSEPWSTLTPEGSYAGTITDYSYTFGIAINPVTADGKKVKRDVVTQIGDGQIQATTSTASTAAAVVTQIGDGQIQADTTTKTTAAAVVTQIGDGQIQADTTTKTSKTTKSTAAAVVTQIGDGQIQADTTTKTTSTKKTAAAVVTQIGDADTTTTSSTAAAVVTQIGDGQIQADTTTKSKKATASGVVTQISDGQIQATTSTKSAASQISDGQVQAATSSAEAAEDDSSNPVDSVSCYNEDALAMLLNNSILTDGSGRIGSIVANRQFQFDGPPPQAGAIYAAGWSITDEGRLAIGNTTVFYQCLSGSFYNLYDESIGDQCTKVYLDVVDLVKC
ncbi:hypothetical protein CANARDRAFT_230540 [[Candida] arabinofermentans NRRL YB-2248]|uniref:Cell wall mannoprotein PIR1-like C-terminal domain-containing protein n=1 Tax=[Candida] arabinofermentans NRRL YB-2248 TaxID=983967 RepID=A0A1E4T4G9_9ASCO|nr:hypothetical protein CANARDRAFT_230540 [[Candida] arabinofermentans NRRL YB-2248]